MNYFAIADPTLDSLITEARNSEDFAERKAIYRKCLDIILDWAVEVPAYQKQNMVIYSSERVKIATITPNLTPFWSWSSEIEKLEMN